MGCMGFPCFHCHWKVQVHVTIKQMRSRTIMMKAQKHMIITRKNAVMKEKSGSPLHRPCIGRQAALNAFCTPATRRAFGRCRCMSISVHNAIKSHTIPTRFRLDSARELVLCELACHPTETNAAHDRVVYFTQVKPAEATSEYLFAIFLLISFAFVYGKSRGCTPALSDSAISS